MKYSIRPLTKNDIPLIINYWDNLTSTEMSAMGVDPFKIPSRSIMTSKLETLLDPSADTPTRYLICEVDGVAVGCGLATEIQVGFTASLHFHIWKPQDRRKGYGTAFIPVLLENFAKSLKLQTIVMEPAASNAIVVNALSAHLPIIERRMAPAHGIVAEIEVIRFEWKAPTAA